MAIVEKSPELHRTFDTAYDMSESDLQTMTRQLLMEHKDKLPDSMPFVCIRIRGDDPLSNIARKVEGDVFSLDLADNPSEMKDEYRPYENASYFYISVDMSKECPAGVLRIIVDNCNGFMTLNAISEEPHNVDINRFYADYNTVPQNVWDVGTIAVMPEYRRAANSTQEQALNSYVVSGLLYRALYAGARANDIETFVSLIDLVALKKLRNLGIPFMDIYDMPPKVYPDGSVFQPSVASVNDFDREMRLFARKTVEARSQGNGEMKKALELQAMINELLTGNALDGMMTFSHNSIKPQCISAYHSS